MSDETGHSGQHDPGAGPGNPEGSQQFKHTPVSARVPEKVRCGVFCTGTMILQTGDEFVIDFLSTIVPPQQVVGRVVMNAATFAGTVPALQTSIAKYEEQFGKLPARPSPGTPAQQAAQSGGQSLSHEAVAAAGVEPGATTAAPASPSVERVYDDLKFPDELLGGCYANAVMIRHTADEFCFDFITNFYPRSAVTSRVYLAVGRVASFFDAMSSALKKYQRRSTPPPA